MLSGSRPRGNSSTPVSGKIGRMSGSASPGSAMAASREHQRRELAPRAEGQRIGRPHDLEELDQLLARRLLVPVAVLAIKRQQLIDPGRPPADVGRASRKASVW